MGITAQHSTAQHWKQHCVVVTNAATPCPVMQFNQLNRNLLLLPNHTFFCSIFCVFLCCLCIFSCSVACSQLHCVHRCADADTIKYSTVERVTDCATLAGIDCLVDAYICLEQLLGCAHIAHCCSHVQGRCLGGTCDAVWTVVDTGSSQIGIVAQQHRQGRSSSSSKPVQQQ